MDRLLHYKVENPHDFLRSFIRFIVETTKYENDLLYYEKKKESDEIYNKVLENSMILKLELTINS